jgi:hypothetical protein
MRCAERTLLLCYIELVHESEEGWVALRATQRWDAFHLSQPTTVLELCTGMHHFSVDRALQIAS